MSDVSISLISKKEIAQEDLAQMTTEEERQAALEDYADGLKDMKIGTVQASKNVFITSEKAILNADSNSSIKGEQIVLSASNGSIGESDSAVKLSANRDITAYAGNGEDVYLTSDKDLKINEIRSYNTYNSETGETTSDSTLGNVVLSSAGNITNAAIDEDKANVSADNIVLNAKNDIGSPIKYFTVDTKSNDLAQGLTYGAQNAYIKGLHNDLNVIESSVNGISNITAADGLSIAVQNSTAGESLNINSTADTVLTGDISAKNITVKSKDETKLSNVTTDGNLVNTSNSIVTENAELNNLTTNSVTADIAGTTISEYGNITTTDTTTIADLNVNGEFTNTSGDTNVEGKLTVGGNATINADKTISIANADITGDLNANSKDVTIDEMNLAGNINSKVDNLVINASNDLNIGSIVGNTKDYATNVEINSGKSIYNGRNDNGTNINAQNITLNAGQSISTSEKPLNITLAEGNKISMNANDSISVSTDGAGANWSDITTGSYQLTTDDDINIDKLNVNNINIHTTSSNLAIQNMVVGQGGTLDVVNKHIVIDNTSLKPVINADVQFYLSKQPAQLIINGSDNIITDSVNVARQAQGLTINKDGNYSSMNNSLTSSTEAALKNTKVGEKTIEKTDTLVYTIPTQKAYQNNYEKMLGQGIIKNQIDEIVTPKNAFSVINSKKQLQGLSKRDVKKNKVSSL